MAVEKGGYQTPLILDLFGKKVHLTRNVLWNGKTWGSLICRTNIKKY